MRGESWRRISEIGMLGHLSRSGEIIVSRQYFIRCWHRQSLAAPRELKYAAEARKHLERVTASAAPENALIIPDIFCAIYI